MNRELINYLSSKPLCGKPLCIESKSFDILLSGRHDFFNTGKATSSKAVSNKADGSNSIAIINVHSALSKRGGLLHRMFGGSDYESLSSELNKALADDGINAILLDIDSPGGDISGLFDFVDEIYAARNKKPIWAIANDGAYSAAYAIASSASKIFVNRTAGLGSIGVIASHLDQSVLNEKQGLKVTTIFAGSKKNDLNQHEPLGAEARDRLQAEVDRVYDIFVSTVARNRNLNKQQVIDTQAGTYFGEDAIKAGLADSILPSNEVINLMAKEFQFNNKEKIMAKETLKIEAAEVDAAKVDATEVDATQVGAVDTGITKISSAIGIEAIKQQAETHGREAMLAEIKGLIKICATAKKLDKIPEFIESGLNANAAKDKLLEILSTENNQNISSNINSYINAIPIGKNNEESPLIKSAKQRAGENK